jgi:hypothetical protein
MISMFFESIMLVGPKAYVERHRCVRSLCLPACSFIPAFIDLLPSTSLHQPSHSEPRLVMLWMASSSNQPQYQYPPPTRESLIQSPPISPLSHSLQTQNLLQKPPPPDAAIVRTLRTTNGNAEPLHSCARSSVGHQLASMVVLLGSELCTDQKINRIVSSLLSLGMRHPKSSVRALCCIAWRSVTWVYFRSPLPVESDAEVGGGRRRS